jgi:hypothetical protein
MRAKISHHFRENAVGYVALFVALSASAYALPGHNNVRSDDIKDGQVKLGDLAVDSVDPSKVVDNSLSGADIAEETLGEVPSASTAESAQSAQTAQSAASADTAATAQNAATLDNLDSTDFLRTNAQSGGDLAGPFSNLQIGAGKVGTAEVDGSLTGADIADSFSGSDDVNADAVDGRSILELLHRSGAQSGGVQQFPTFFDYEVNTTGPATTLELDRIELRTTGTLGQFKICSNSANTIPVVRYVMGVRTVPTVEANGSCTATFTVNAGEDFEIAGASVIVWGFNASSSAPAGAFWDVFAIDPTLG